VRDPAPRAIRVFVSSTFRDFTAERDRLARFTFPRLRRTCEERAVVFTDVDLRWGITDEQAAEGEVLPICLAEIDASRPFFIGILGERYGWVPDSIADDLVERHPWLEEHRRKSVTELEIVHGVLNDPEMAGRAFFYFRDEAASRAIGPDAIPESEEAAEKLADLKARIKASGLPLKEGFTTPEDLETAVLADVTAVIDELFPEDEVPDPVERERLTHEAFGYELAAGFVERPDLLATLDSHAAGDGAPLLVTGESGSGKSALLAYWSRQYARAHVEVPVITHFCGASAAASDWVALCRRVAAELEPATGVTAGLPDDPAELKGAFRDLLFRAAAAKRFVLVLDGVDQLEDRDGAPELSFLPPELPAGARVVLSTALATRPEAECSRREWDALLVGELEVPQREEVLGALLASHVKSLDSAHVDLICSSPASSSPLFLSVLADELSVVGSHDTFEGVLARYLEVVEVDDLYQRVLERWERDYDTAPGLVRGTMCAIWAAREGMAEHELLEMLGGSEPLPQAYLAPLLLGAGRQLASRGGRLVFTHSLLHKAIHDSYLNDEASQRSAHVALADYFEDRLTSSAAATVLQARFWAALKVPTDTRSLDETGWQLARAAEWDRLHVLLRGPGSLAALWAHNMWDVVGLWTDLERHTQYRVSATFHALRRRVPLEHYQLAVATLRAFRGEVDLLGIEGRLNVLRWGNWVWPLSWLMGVLPWTRVDHASYRCVHAFRLGERAERALDWEGAATHYEDAASWAEEYDLSSVSPSVARYKQRSALTHLDRWDEVLGILESRPESLEHADSGETAQRMVALVKLGRLEEAQAIWSQLRPAMAGTTPAERLPALAAAGQLREALGDLPGALELNADAEAIASELGYLPSLFTCAGRRVTLCLSMERYQDAETAAIHLETLAREACDEPRTTAALALRGMVLGCLQRTAEAEAFLSEAVELNRRTNLRGALGAQTIGLAQLQLARYRYSANDFAGSRLLSTEAARRFVSAGMLGEQADALSQLARANRELGRTNEALQALSREEEIRRKQEQEPELLTCLWSQAEVMRRGLRLTEALEAFEDLRHQRETVGDFEYAQFVCAGESQVLADMGRFDEALDRIEAKERICREIDNPGGLAYALSLRAYVAARQGATVERVLELLRVADDLSSEHGLDDAGRIEETVADIEHAGMTEYARAIRAAFPPESPDA